MPNQEEKRYRIIELRAENIKRLKAVIIRPQGDVIQITGSNASGKTSVLDSIWLALSGAEAGKKNPDVIRQGEDKASVKLDLGDYIVSRRFTKEGSYLDVFTKSGAKYPSPQAVLDKMISTIAFDPLQFTNLESKKQVELLLQFSQISIDIPEHDRKIKSAYDERTIAGKELSKAKTLYESTPKPSSLVMVEVKPLTDLMTERKQIELEKNVAEKVVNDLFATGTSLKNSVTELQSTIKKLEEHLDASKKELTQKETELRQTGLKYKVEKATFDVGNYGGRIAAIDSGIESGDKLRTSNTAIEKYLQAEKTFKTSGENFNAKEKDIHLLRTKREKAIADAKFPIGGLGLSDEGVTFNNIPFVQCSSAERLKVGIAMVISQDPNIRVIRIQDGSLLDSESMAVIVQMAETYDLQFWVEKVDESGKLGVVIEDGEVSADNYETVKIAEVAPPVTEPKPVKPRKVKP